MLYAEQWRYPYPVKKVSEVETAIRNLLKDNINYIPETGESSGNTYSSDMVCDAINFALRLYCKLTRVTYTEVDTTIDFYAGFVPTPIRPFVIPVPYDSLDVIRLSLKDEFRTLHKTTMESEAIGNPSWEYEYGDTVTKWYMKDSRTICPLPTVPESADPLGTFALKTFSVGYIQSPMNVTTGEITTTTSVRSGQWYQIITVGDTDWTTLGNPNLSDPDPNDLLGVVFKVGTENVTPNGSGTVTEVIDPRIRMVHLDYLKYPAASFLLTLQGDKHSIELSEKFISYFKQLVA